MGLAAWHGAFRYFIVAYFESNLVGYVFQARAFFNAAYPKLEYVFGLAQFVWPVVGAIGLGLLVTGWKRHAPPWRTLAYAAGLAGVSLFAVFAPHKPFGHYFLFLIGPLLLLLGTTAGPLLAPLRIAARAGFVLALVTPLAVHHVRHPNYFPAVLNQRTRVPPELVAALQRLTQPDDFMAVWGWRPALYVYTQTMPSARNLNTYWPAVDSPRRDFYRATYLADLKLHPPVVFVDTVGPADFFFKTRVESVNHESFPALDAYVRENYVLVETLSGARVYLRKDRADPPPAKL